jgi:hypothetical protein
MKAILKFILLVLLNFSSRSVGASAVVLDSFSDVNFDVSNVFTAEQLFFCKFFGLGRVGSEDGKKFLGFQRERVILGRER